jgi:MFS family permease
MGAGSTQRVVVLTRGTRITEWIYVVMMVGAPLSGRLADRLGPRRPILAGPAAYTLGLWMLSGIGPGSALLLDVLPGLLIFAVGAAAFTALLVAPTFGALDDSQQGMASAVNNTMGQLAGLLAIAILPVAAGLSGVSLSSPEFALGHGTALRIGAAIAAASTIVAAITFRSTHGRGARVEARTAQD